MSIRLQRLVFDLFPHGGSRLNVLQAIADIADERGQAVASFGQIMKRSRLGRMTAIRAVQRLCKDGWLYRSKKSGQGMMNAYVINLRKLDGR